MRARAVDAVQHDAGGKVAHHAVRIAGDDPRRRGVGPVDDELQRRRLPAVQRFGEAARDMDDELRVAGVEQPVDLRRAVQVSAV